MKATRSIQLFAGAITAVLALHCVQAATGTWNGPSLTGNWDTTDTNWTGLAAGTPWAAQGNSAVFSTASSVATVNANIFVDSWSIGSSGNRVTVNAGQTITENVGNASFLMFGTGHASSADGNTLTINGTFSFGPTINASDVFVVGGDGGGGASSYNGITINTGGMLRRNISGGGTHNDKIGLESGANYNYMDINGGTFDRQGSQRLYVGTQGSYNYMTIRNGGTFTGTQGMSTWGGTGNRVLHIGDYTGGGTGTGGSFNYVNVSGAGSVARVAQVLVVGNGATATDNYLKIENEGAAYVAFSGNTSFVGGSAGANNNYIQVTGVGSTLNVSNSASVSRFLTIGNNATADGNHLDVFSGAAADLRTGVVLGANSATNSKFNLGDGVGISTASVGYTGATAIALTSESARLNIDSGRLIAAANGALVAGAGQIVLNGPAYISTAFTGLSSGSASTITTAISGSGSLTKEGAGLLTLSGTNTYSGNTNVNKGTLELTSDTGLKDTSTVTIDAVNGVLWLNFTGTDNVAGLVIDNVPMPPGVYDNTTTGITGTGTLTVVAVVLTPYAFWAKTNITDKNASADATPGGDPDNDGANNLSEFAFNGDPLSGSDNGKIYLLTADNDTSKKLILTVAVRADTPAFSADNSPTATNTADSLTYTIQGSTSLIDDFLARVNVLGTEVIPAEDPTAGTGYEYRSFSLDGSEGLLTKGFLRAMVTSP